MTTTHNPQKGAALVEFAILLVLLLVLLFGIVDYGFLWLQAHYVENSAREGARVGARIATLNNPPTTVTNLESDVRPAVEGAIRSSLIGLYENEELVNTLVSKISIEGPTIAVPGGTPLSPALRVNVTINSSAYWTPIVWSILNLLPNSDGHTGVASLTGSAAFAIAQQ